MSNHANLNFPKEMIESAGFKIAGLVLNVTKYPVTSHLGTLKNLQDFLQ